MVRWNAQETEALTALRAKIDDVIKKRPQYPEVVGDRKLLRFLRGHEYNIDKVHDLYTKSLRWREENNVDQIRENIVLRGCDHPRKFPHADKVLHHMPHIVIAPHAFDKADSPICVDQYNFSPNDIMNEITMGEYIEFAIYCLEYRQIILEQLSHEREQAYLNSLSEEERNDIMTSADKFYGVIVTTCVIRDLGGVGFEHFGTQGQNIIRSVISIASENYPELMKKCYMINTPWIFNTIWYFIKGLIATRTINKVSILGTDYMSELEANISPDFIPVLVGGKYTGAIDYEPYLFDTKYLVTDIPPALSYAANDTHVGVDHKISSEGKSEGDESVANLISQIILADAGTTSGQTIDVSDINVKADEVSK